MQIEFKKILQSPKSFSLSKDKIELVGDMFFDISSDLVILDSKLKGSLDIECDRCAEIFNLTIDENLIIKVSDGIYSGSEDDDVFEAFEGIIDFDEVLQSEIESIKSDYHICSSCDSIDNFEMEF